MRINLTINELKTTAEFTPTKPKTMMLIPSLTPIPDIPIGDVKSIIIDNRENIKNIIIMFVSCPNDKNRKKNNNASKNVLNIVTKEL